MRGLLITLSTLLTSTHLAASSAWAFNPNDLIVYQTRNDVTGLSNAAPVSLLDISPTAGLVQSYPLLNLASPLYSTTNDPIANLALSNNNTQVSFTGWTTKGTLGTVLGLDPSIPRGVGTLDPSGNYAQPSTFLPTGTPGRPDQPHTAYSSDGVNWYFGATSGIYYNNATAPLTGSDATVAIKGFAGKTYALHTLDTPFIQPNGTDAGPNSGATVLSSITPTTAGPGITSVTFTNLITLPTAAHDFLLLSSISQSPDTLYVTTNFGIAKFALINNVWSSEGTISLPGTTAITGQLGFGVGAILYVTVNTGTGQSAVGTLDKIFDTAAHNATLTAAAPTILYTAPALDALEGVVLAPTPEPAPLALLSIPFFALLIKRRNFNAPRVAPSPSRTSY